MNYKEFLQTKEAINKDSGFDIKLSDINPKLFDFQKTSVKWALKKGKSACFADTGLGKTVIQLEWANQVWQKEKKPILILAPLAVSYQTERESKKFQLCHTKVCESQTDILNGINITNYEKLSRFNADEFIGVVLDESSILKSYTGKTKELLIDSFKNTKYKLACTATPSPNDHMEILNHSQFLNVLDSKEALAIWFINDTMNMGTYRLKKYAVKDFWEWVSTWAISVTKPSDITKNKQDDIKFKLPALNTIEKIINVDLTKGSIKGFFREVQNNATSFHKEKRLTLLDRVTEVKKIIETLENEQCVIWCNTNYEADEIKKQIPYATEVRGSDTLKIKEKAALDFINKKINVLISKPTIFGFGLNFQNCSNVIYCGLNFSFESYYQSVRRFWRYGQKKQVNVYVVIGETERSILNIIHKKQNQHLEMKKNMQEFINKTQNKRGVYSMEYEKKEEKTKNFHIIQGDAVSEIKNVKDNQVGLSVFSPPFSNLYIYSDSYRDMGNTKNDKAFFKHFNFLIPELYRITKPGRLCVIHCKDLVDYINRDGKSGLRDFPGAIIKAFEKHNWKYHSKITIWKDPAIEMQRTKCHGLLHKQLCKDSSFSRNGLPDYLIVMRKWAKEEEETSPVNIKESDLRFVNYIGNEGPTSMKGSKLYSIHVWQKYASPVWFDIRQTNVLNIKLARGKKDEKHICPLQLDVIERCIELWSNPSDIVCDPFAGICSTGYVALSMNRKFLGWELKKQYFGVGVKYLKAIEKAHRKLIQ